MGQELIFPEILANIFCSFSSLYIILMWYIS